MPDSPHVTSYEIVIMKHPDGQAVGVIARCSCGWKSEPLQADVKVPDRVVQSAFYHRRVAGLDTKLKE